MYKKLLNIKIPEQLLRLYIQGRYFLQISMFNVIISTIISAAKVILSVKQESDIFITFRKLERVIFRVNLA